MNAAQLLKSIRTSIRGAHGPVHQIVLRTDTARCLLNHPVYGPRLHGHLELLRPLMFRLFHVDSTTVREDLDAPYLLIHERECTSGIVGRYTDSAASVTGGRE